MDIPRPFIEPLMWIWWTNNEGAYNIYTMMPKWLKIIKKNILTRKKKNHCNLHLQGWFSFHHFPIRDTTDVSVHDCSRQRDYSLKVTKRHVLLPDVEFILVGHYVRFILNRETIFHCSSDHEPNVMVGGNKSPTRSRLIFIEIWVGDNIALNCNSY